MNFEKVMRTRLKTLWGVLLLAALLGASGVPVYAQTPNQNFSWTVIGTGTETWYTTTTNYISVTATISGYHPNPPWDIETITAGVSGLGTYHAHLDPPADFGFWVYTTLSVGSTTIFNDVVGNANQPETIDRTFNASANTLYTVEAYDADFTGGSTVTVSVPQSIQQQPHTATRQMGGYGTGVVNATDGEKNLGGFYAPPQPQAGGTISGVVYTLSWNNVNVLMFFSDTRTTSTTNPNASVIVVTPGAYGGTPQTVPGRIHLERYDTGGQDVAYHDADANNWGNWRLNEGVDLVYDTNSGAAMIGWCEPGEWVKFSVNVQKSTNYTVVFWQGAPGKGGTNFLAVDGNVVTGPLVVPDTGSWTVFQPVRNNNVFISAGFHILQLYEQNYTTAAVGMGDISAIDIVEYPQITQPPVSQTASLNSNATMSVTASGTGLAYQWYFNSNSIAGATNAVLALTNLQLAQSGQYGVTCSNAAAVVASANATLTVTQSPQILTSAATFGIRTNRFGFAVAGYSNLVVVIEACTNLSNANWIALQTNTLGTNTWYFNDNGWTNYRNRYYRVRTQ